MRITFIGAGAMGGLFGALMTEAGLDVSLVDIWEEHVRAIREGGLEIQLEGRVRRVELDIHSDFRRTRAADLAVVFTKGPQTAEAARAAREVLAPGGLALTLQNGLGNADVLVQILRPEAVLTGTTAHGSTVLGPGSILHGGRGPTIIGPWAGAPLDRVEEVAAVFNRAGIETQVQEDVTAVVWNKLLVNVGINAIVALTHTLNRAVIELPVTKELSRLAVEEGLAVARALGVKVREDAVEHCYEVARAVGANRASMGQDVDAKRETEIGTINGAIVRLGREQGLPTPVNFTLCALIETWQHNYLKKGDRT